MEDLDNVEVIDSTPYSPEHVQTPQRSQHYQIDNQESMENVIQDISENTLAEVREMSHDNLEHSMPADAF